MAIRKKDVLQEETEIIRAVATGDKKAFASLYSQYSAKVYNTAISYTKNTEEAEEVTQDVFVKIFHKAETFKAQASLSTWIYRITVNTSLNYLKKKKRLESFRSSVSTSHQIDFEHPGVLMENRENAAALFKVISSLPGSQKTAFILSYIEELPRQEVADIMEVSLKAVESLLQRGKSKMRTELSKLYPNRRKLKK